MANTEPKRVNPNPQPKLKTEPARKPKYVRMPKATELRKAK